jgi:hypothetical protein
MKIVVILRLKEEYKIDGGLINKGFVMRIKYSNALFSFMKKQQRVS